MQNWKQLLLLFAFIFITTYSTASHIVGGDITYEFVGFNAAQTEAEIEIHLTMYRDPQGIPYDPIANFGVYVQEPWGAWRSFDVIENVPIGPIRNVPNDSDPCKTRFLSTAAMQEATYTTRLTLPIGNNNYTISYQKCCRNYTINNIIGTGGDLGSVYDILITPDALRNGSSSPVFAGKPPIFICSFFEQNIDQSAVDVDGDQITYSFCNPLYTGPPGTNCGGNTQNPDPALCPPPYPTLDYLPPFSNQNPMGGSPQIEINPATGIMTGVPVINGSYVVGICLEERRNGILLTRMRRDYEFNVVECNENLQAKIESDTYLKDAALGPLDSIAYFETCDPQTFDFVNLSEDQTYIQDYKWEIYDPQGDLVYDDNGAALRDISFYFEEEGKYQALMILNDGGDCYDTAYIQVYHVPDVNIETNCVYDTCFAGPVSFVNETQTNHSELSWLWNFGDGDSSADFSPLHSYAARGDYNIDIVATDTFGCTTMTSKVIEWYPYELLPPDTLERSEVLCYHDSIYIYDEWVHVDGTYFNYIPSQFTGCDSIVERIMVAFTEVIPTTTLVDTICAEETYSFANGVLDITGEYEETFMAQDDCDSLVQLSLFVRDPIYVIEDLEICEGEEYAFGNTLITTAGDYQYTFISQDGCDSLVYLSVAVVQQKSLTIQADFCEGETYTYNNDVYDESGVFSYNYVSSDMVCDSIVTLVLTENFDGESELTAYICEGGYYELGSERYTEPGLYQYDTETTKGCDSTIFLDLTVLPDVEYEFQDTICLGEVYPFGSVDLSIEGIYYDTLFNTNGCDSIVILDLKVGQNLTKINVDEELEENYGETIILEPDVSGGDLVTTEWFQSEEVLSDELVLLYLVQDDNWVYFESMNDLYCVALDSVFIRSRIDIDIYFPNIISPDGDRFNDIFNIGASETVKNSQLFIYDRWGNEMYVGDVIEDKDISIGWDGTFKNETVSNGTYVYLVQVEFINGLRKLYKGEVQVLR